MHNYPKNGLEYARRLYLKRRPKNYFYIYFNRLNMPASIKTAEELEKMRIAGRLTAEVLEMIAPTYRSG